MWHFPTALCLLYELFVKKSYQSSVPRHDIFWKKANTSTHEIMIYRFSSSAYAQLSIEMSCFCSKPPASVTTFLSSQHQDIRIYHECEDSIEKSDARIAVWHHEACRVMTNGDCEGQIFLLHSYMNNGCYSCSPLNTAF